MRLRDSCERLIELHGLLGRLLGHLRLQLLEERLRPTGGAAPLASTA